MTQLKLQMEDNHLLISRLLIISDVYLHSFIFLFSGISQSEFETVIPKQENAYVLIVSGKHKGQVIIVFTILIETDILMIKD